MFGIGGSELIVIAIIALIALGPERMPGFLKLVGKSVREVRKQTRELRSSIGIDELLRDESFRDPLGLKETAGTSSTQRTQFSDDDRIRERPLDGVDIEYIRNSKAFRRSDNS